MASQRASRRRNPGRPGNPASGPSDEAADAIESSVEAPKRKRSTRTAAAPGVAESAQGAPEADAAAAAAAAAVSAAIAATAAATRGGGAPAAALSAAATPSPAAAPGAAPAPAPSDAPAAAPGAPAPPVWPGSKPPPTGPSVNVPYERPPARDVPGLIRARRDEPDDTAAAQVDDIPPPSAMPWVVNPAPPEQVSSFFPMAEPARSTPPPTIVEEVTVPEPATPSASAARSDAAGGSVVALPATRTTLGHRIRAGVIYIGSAFAVFCVPILMGLGRLATSPVRAVRRRLAGTGSVEPALDASGSPRRRSLVSPIWLVVGGFYLFLALILGAAWYTTVASVPSPSATPSHAATPYVTVATPSAAPSMTPTPTSSTSSSPTPVPTKPLLTVEETAPVPVGTSATFRVQFIPGSDCRLTRAFVQDATPRPSPTPVSPKTSSSFPIQAEGWSLKILWGGKGLGWPAEAGTWTVTASCTPHGGGTASPPSNPVTVTWQ
jgi:hypothetical protein